MSRISDLQQRFQAFAGRPGRVSFAPGRINLIGEHTDYSAGFVLPASLALGTWTVAAPRDDRNIRVLSEGQHETEVFPLDVTPRAATQALERLCRRRGLGPATGGVHSCAAPIC